jgi:hypothetical protein
MLPGPRRCRFVDAGTRAAQIAINAAWLVNQGKEKKTTALFSATYTNMPTAMAHIQANFPGLARCPHRNSIRTSLNAMANGC